MTQLTLCNQFVEWKVNSVMKRFVSGSIAGIYGLISRPFSEEAFGGLNQMLIVSTTILPQIHT